MNFTKEDRMQISREIYTHEITISEATEKYGVNWYTARSYMRQYRDLNNLPPMSDGQEELNAINKSKKKKYEDLESMSKDQLINEVIKARVEAERAKKGYAVKGGGHYEIVYKLSSEFSINKLCLIMNVNRSGFYKWRNNMLNPSPRTLKRNSDIALFKEYHNKYPTHVIVG